MRLVTVDVPQLPERIISQALQCGAQTVRELISKEKINSAYLSLQKQTLIIENNLTEMING
jgi:hypothetical protein